MKNIKHIIGLLLVISPAVINAGFGDSFGGAFAGSATANILTQPRRVHVSSDAGSYELRRALKSCERELSKADRKIARLEEKLEKHKNKSSQKRKRDYNYSDNEE